MTSGSNVVPSISAALALPASAARRSKSRAEARSPLFIKSVPRLTSVAISSASRRLAVLPPCAGSDCGPETGALATCDGCDGGEGGTLAGAGSACSAGLLVSVGWFGTDDGRAAAACEGSRSPRFRESVPRSTEGDGCNGGEGGTLAGAGSACSAGLLASVCWFGTDDGSAAAACEGSGSPRFREFASRLTEGDGCDGGGEGGTVAGAGSACSAGLLAAVGWFGTGGGTGGAACEGSRSPRFRESVSRLTERDGCDGGEGGTMAGTGLACSAGLLAAVGWFGTEGGAAAGACEGPLRLTEIDGAGTGAGAASSATCHGLGRTNTQATSATTSATAQPTAPNRNMIDAKLRHPRRVASGHFPVQQATATAELPKQCRLG